MIWFQRLFPVFMLTWPVAFVLCVRPRDGGGTGRRGRVLLGVTLAFLAVHAAASVWLEGSFPLHHPLRVGWTVGLSVFGGLLLWFLFAVPALGERIPALGRSPEPGPQRGASLVPRQQLDPVPRAAWVAGWTLFALCTAATAWAIGQGAPWVLALGLLHWLLAGALASRRSLLEPEPLDPAGSPEIAEAYRALRRLKAWGFYWLGLLGCLLFAAVALAFAVSPDSAGWIGAVGGTAAGVCGGLFGALAGLRRARIAARLRELGAG